MPQLAMTDPHTPFECTLSTDMITEVYAKSELKKTECSFLLKKVTFIIVNKDLYK